MPEIQSPLAGYDNSLAYQYQAPYSTPRLRNVRPFDVFELRARLGSRPCYGKTHQLQLGSGSPVRMLEVVNAIQSDNFDFFNDSFPGYQADELAGDAFGSNWSQSTFAAKPTLETHRTYDCAVCDGTTESGLISSTAAFTDLSATAYRIGIFIVPYLGEHQGTYRIHARLNNSTPSITTDSVIGELTLSRTGVYSGFLRRYVAGVLTSNAFVSGTIGYDAPGWFELDVSSTTTVACYWQGVTLISQTVAAAAGHRFGFSLQGATSASKCLVDRFRFQYFRTSKFELARPRIITSAGGIVYRERYFGELQAVSSSLTLASGQRLFAADLNNKLFIADWDNPLAAAADGTFSSTSFDSATYSDWTTLGISTNDHSLQNLGGTGPDTLHPVLPESHAITTVASGALTVRPSPGVATGTAVTFKVVRHPKYYDPVANTLNPYVATYYGTGSVSTASGVMTISGGTFPDWIEGKTIRINDTDFTVNTLNSDGTATLTDTTATESGPFFISKGRVPLGCRILRRWGNRIVMTGDPASPQGIYMSAVDDAFDWDYGVDLDTAAWSSASSDISTLGEPIMDFMVWRRDLAIIGCRGSLHLFSGDPRRSGRVEEITRRLGLAAPGAWCTIPTGEILFLTSEGIYITDTGCESCEPKPFSNKKLPNELMDVGFDSDVHFEYDNQYNGVTIQVANKFRRAGVASFWFDLGNKGFWPDRYAVGHTTTAIRNYPAVDGGDACVLYGHADGYIRRQMNGADTDDGTPVASSCFIGPLKMGDIFNSGMLRVFRGVIDRSSGNVGVRFYVGNSPQEALDSTPIQYDGTLQPGTSRELKPRAGGGSGFIEVSGQGIAWAIDAMAVEIQRQGRLRLR